MAEKQLIITIGREFGSGGRVIGHALAERFDIDFYDSEIINDLAEKQGVDPDRLARYDEKPRSVLWSRTVRGYSTSNEEALAQLQFHLIREIADEGKSFVLIGRCGETVLAGRDGLIRVFVQGDMETKNKRIQERYHLNESEAAKMIHDMDKKRKTYHNTYCDGKWGDSRSYDITINSSRLGIDGTVDVLEYFVCAYIKGSN